ncbi:DUF3310 domain-containing protein [Listeria monocytogenes]|nr:DUF3310 domain-containing protein [Listeria monocytogenes]EIA8103706.1 DUF3310 domain-containing protein [Listeria monocytogenes]
MKLYHTETQEDFDALLEELKNEGYCWSTDEVITPDDYRLWKKYEQDTAISVGEKGLSFGDVHYRKRLYPEIEIKEYKAKSLEEDLKLYHTETQEDFDALLENLKNEGWTWFFGEVITSDDSQLWERYKQDTIVYLEGKGLSYGNTSYAKDKYSNIPIEKYKAEKTEPIDPIKNFAEAWNKAMKSHLIESTGTSDNINNPAHYTSGGIETLDYIKAKVSDYPSYAIGKILEYVSRYEHKNGLEDLKKAQFYLNDLIEWME